MGYWVQSSALGIRRGQTLLNCGAYSIYKPSAIQVVRLDQLYEATCCFAVKLIIAKTDATVRGID